MVCVTTADGDPLFWVFDPFFKVWSFFDIFLYVLSDLCHQVDWILIAQDGYLFWPASDVASSRNFSQYLNSKIIPVEDRKMIFKVNRRATSSDAFNATFND